MKERPILFSGPMVQAILDGRKTQTRRVVVPPKSKHRVWRMDGQFTVDPGGTWLWGPGPYLKVPFRHVDDPWEENPEEDTRDRVFCPYGYPEDGARLWVREAWAQPWSKGEGRPVIYRSTYHHPEEASASPGPWRPSIFMPRWASRITLEITSVRVERLQDISLTDIEAEGTPYSLVEGERPYGSRTEQFQRLWDSINAARGYGWDANPWVWVLSFRRAQ
jgi:hypothetical protein